MEAVAKAKYVRTSCRKMRQVVDNIRGLRVEQALGLLHGLKSQKSSAEVVDKVLKSAIANYQSRNEDAAGRAADELVVKNVWVDKGPIVKRIRPRAQGRAFRIHKNLSHLTVVISDEARG